MFLGCQGLKPQSVVNRYIFPRFFPSFPQFFPSFPQVFHRKSRRAGLKALSVENLNGLCPRAMMVQGDRATVDSTVATLRDKGGDNQWCN